MRWLVSAALMLAWPAPGHAQDSKPPADPGVEATRASAADELTRAEAARYRIELADAGDRAVALEPDPVLRWSNPVAGSIHGSVFVWTDRGCPVAIASIYKWSSPNQHLGVELHALTPNVVGADRAGRRVWSPKQVAMDRRPIPNAPLPAESPASRLRQMTALAGEFRAQETTRTNEVRPLRLLPKPLVRYASTDPDVIDGALFGFVQATDPEIVLVVEARRTASGAEWSYAAARMNSLQLRLDHEGREAWSAPMMSWGAARNHALPYTLYIYGSDPGIPADGPLP